MSRPSVLRPSDDDALRAELRRGLSDSGVAVAFGGQVRNGTAVLSQLFGNRTNGLDGVQVPERLGLGGRAMQEGRPLTVADYGVDQTITHQFDRPVLTEGIHSVLAVPVMVAGVARAVLYGAIRTRMPVGDRAMSAFVLAARRLSNEFVVRDEVDRRVRMLSSVAPDSDPRVAADLRDIHADLRDLATRVDDPALQTSLRGLAERVAHAGSGPATDAAPDATLSPREVDVLAHVALGCTNIDVAERMSVSPETVKSYLRSAMRKLGARTRHEAVVRARRHGLLP